MMQVNTQELGQRIRRARTALEMTQSEFGEPLDVHSTTISRWELGGVDGIPWRTIAEITQTYGINLAWLATGKGEMFNQPEPAAGVCNGNCQDHPASHQPTLPGLSAPQVLATIEEEMNRELANQELAALAPDGPEAMSRRLQDLETKVANLDQRQASIPNALGALEDLKRRLEDITARLFKAENTLHNAAKAFCELSDRISKANSRIDQAAAGPAKLERVEKALMALAAATVDNPA